MYLDEFGRELGNTYAIFRSAEKFMNELKLIAQNLFPWAIYIGSNGNLEMVVIDKRTYPYKFGLLSFIPDDSDFINLGETFKEFLNRLSENTAFEH